MDTIYKYLEKYAPLFLRMAIAMAFTSGIKSPLDGESYRVKKDGCGMRNLHGKLSTSG